MKFDPTLAQRTPELFEQPLDIESANAWMIDEYQPLELDQKQLQRVSYPEAGSTNLELHFNRSKPFAWAWVLFLVALLVVIISLMVKSKRLFYSLGLLITLVALGHSIYGFTLRILISGRPPVTDSYETVIWVSFFTALLGWWFVLLPWIWPGMSWSWRLAGLPFRSKRNSDGEWRGLTIDRAQPGEEEKVLASKLSLVQSLISVYRLAIAVGIVWFLSQSKGHFDIVDLTLPMYGDSIAYDRLFTWGVGIAVVLFTAWFGSRFLCSLSLQPLTIYTEAKGNGKRIMDQMLARKWFLLGSLPIAFIGMLLAHYVGLLHTNQVLNPNIRPLNAVLRNNFWLSVHVIVIVSSYAAGALALGLGNLAMFYYLFGRYSKRRATARPLHPANGQPISSGTEPATASQTAVPSSEDVVSDELPKQSLRERLKNAGSSLKPSNFKKTIRASFQSSKDGNTLEESANVRPPKEVSTLANYGYKAMQVAVVLLAVGTILGGLWADVSWGRFWDWDPKEVWALISLLVYVAVLHARYAGWVKTFGTCACCVVCFNAILMSWYGVNNILPKFPGWLDGTGKTTAVGLHSYAGGEVVGLKWIVGIVLSHFFLVLLAWGRFVFETTSDSDSSLNSTQTAIDSDNATPALQESNLENAEALEDSGEVVLSGKSEG